MNVYKYSLPKVGEEQIETLLSQNKVTINRIVSNTVNNSQWYDQDEDEWLVLLEGEAILSFEDEEIGLTKGDTYYIVRHRKHTVKKTSNDALWLTVHIL